MNVTVLPIVIGALGAIPIVLVKGLEDLEIRERAETIQIKALLRSTRILRRVLETKNACCFSKSSERQSAGAGVKNLYNTNYNL